ncbi:low temperature requirement A [Pochonia chlamydosporia 170]|uniref:Low temperature requirement A n=1 Tax=Pochonia chlamydosporia 170 TaxID=1380566 RepID=A0A179FUJ0_METCM|nr:low temperature requirement A [Pochonia chlamydosporia 170]OAQ68898.1 low temperature requirement A [Pochonia chlamydosporia 170]
MASHEHHHHMRERLKFLKTPVADNNSSSHTDHNIDKSGPGEEGVPKLKRYEEPTLLEIFYDLFFAANYTVFSENREVTNHNSFKAYIGYFCLLWLTWFLVASYDVRFVTDSIFERTARALQLGVLVGFAVVAPTFDPSNQKSQTMRTMSLILMFSRAVLAVEYASTLWHVRKYKKCRIPLYVSIGVNIVTMLIYLGITFRFEDNKSSRVFMTWYFISAAEAIFTLITSSVWPVLSFTESHLMKRLTLITAMILGDGLVNIAKEVVTMVKAPQAWDPLTIGLITAGVATIYFVFLIYFDWLRSSFHLPPIRQLIWTALHLPFHLSLVLFMQAFTQYIIWSKVMNVINKLTSSYFSDGSDDPSTVANFTSAQIASYFKNETNYYFSLYPAKMPQTLQTVNLAIQNISSLPDSLWPQLAKLAQTEDETTVSDSNQDPAITFLLSYNSILTSLINNLFQVFGIDLAKDIIQPTQNITQNTGNVNAGMLQNKVTTKTWRRYRLVFAYGYIAAGCCLLLMAIMSVISRTTRWKPWPIIRLIILIILALGTGLISLLWFTSPKDEDEEFQTGSEDLCWRYISTPWVLLTIFIVYTTVLVLTHIGGNGESLKRAGTFLSFKKKQSYEPVDLPMTPGNSWGSASRKGDHDSRQQDQQGRSESPYELHRRGGTRTAHSSSERPTSSYDPLKESTEYRGATHV